MLDVKFGCMFVRVARSIRFQFGLSSQSAKPSTGCWTGKVGPVGLSISWPERQRAAPDKLWQTRWLSYVSGWLKWHEFPNAAPGGRPSYLEA